LLARQPGSGRRRVGSGDSKFSFWPVHHFLSSSHRRN
jgi:hypothetical protein